MVGTWHLRKALQPSSVPVRFYKIFSGMLCTSTLWSKHVFTLIMRNDIKDMKHGPRCGDHAILYSLLRKTYILNTGEIFTLWPYTVTHTKVH
jgi:hypothetical protein